jgi:hypothetical protein
MRELPASQGCDLASAAGVEYGQGHPVNTPPRPESQQKWADLLEPPPPEPTLITAALMRAGTPGRV